MLMQNKKFSRAVIGVFLFLHLSAPSYAQNDRNNTVDISSDFLTSLFRLVETIIQFRTLISCDAKIARLEFEEDKLREIAGFIKDMTNAKAELYQSIYSGRSDIETVRAQAIAALERVNLVNKSVKDLRGLPDNQWSSDILATTNNITGVITIKSSGIENMILELSDKSNTHFLTKVDSKRATDIKESISCSKAYSEMVESYAFSAAQSIHQARLRPTPEGCVKITPPTVSFSLDQIKNSDACRRTNLP